MLFAVGFSKLDCNVSKDILQAEAIIVSKIIAGQCSSSMMKVNAVSFLYIISACMISYDSKFYIWFIFYVQSYAYFLASLPKSRGDKDSWVVMMQDLLTSIDIHLNDVFQCLEQGK